jgi:hypothetical protein
LFKERCLQFIACFNAPQGNRIKHAVAQLPTDAVLRKEFVDSKPLARAKVLEAAIPKADAGDVVKKWTLLPKFELLPLTETERKHQRFVFDPSPTYLVSAAPLMMRLLHVLKEVMNPLNPVEFTLHGKRYSIVTSCGHSATELGAWFHENATDHCVDVDGSAYDATTTKGHVTGLAWLLTQFGYTKQEADVLLTGLEGVTAATRDRSLSVTTTSGLPSGHPCTYCFNTLRNAVESLTVASASGIGAKIMVCGDDTLICLASKPPESWTPDAIRNYARFGTIAKVVVRKRSHAKFLSSHFIPCDVADPTGKLTPSHVLAPLQARLMGKVFCSLKVADGKLTLPLSQELYRRTAGYDALRPVLLLAGPLLATADDSRSPCELPKEAAYIPQPSKTISSSTATHLWHAEVYGPSAVSSSVMGQEGYWATPALAAEWAAAEM